MIEVIQEEFNNYLSAHKSSLYAESHPIVWEGATPEFTHVLHLEIDNEGRYTKLIKARHDVRSNKYYIDKPENNV